MAGRIPKVARLQLADKKKVTQVFFYKLTSSCGIQWGKGFGSWNNLGSIHNALAEKNDRKIGASCQRGESKKYIDRHIFQCYSLIGVNSHCQPRLNSSMYIYLRQNLEKVLRSTY